MGYPGSKYGLEPHKTALTGLPCRPRKRDNPEGRLVRQIIAYLRACGAVGGKIKTLGVVRHGRYTLDPYLFRGVADLMFFYQGRLYFCECKAPKGRQSPEQTAFEILCQGAGITYILARTLEDVSAVIKPQ